MQTDDLKISLNSMADKYWTEKALGPDAKQMDFIRARVLPYCKGPKVLELGCGNGAWTEALTAKGFDVTVVEGSELLIDSLQKKMGASVKLVHSLFEEFQTADKFQTVIASCVLEHVENPAQFLSLLKSWLAPGGDLHIIVPNALSLHRRVGLKMGLIQHPLELSSQELEVGHRHSFTLESFREKLELASLKVNFIKGVFLKPLSSGQMMDWPENLLEGYNSLSDELPEYTAFLYANCSP